MNPLNTATAKGIVARSVFLLALAALTLSFASDAVADCDYSNSVNGWGWNSKTMQSCPPVATQEPLAKFLSSYTWLCEQQILVDDEWSLPQSFTQPFSKAFPEYWQFYFTSSGVAYVTNFVSDVLVSVSQIDWGVVGMSLSVNGKLIPKIELQASNKTDHLRLYTNNTERLSCEKQHVI